MLKLTLLLMAGLILSGCASLQPRVEKVSLQSYEQGCALRGIQKGMTGDEAQAVCRCHVDKAVTLTSRERFLKNVEFVGNADDAQRQSEAFRLAVTLLKSTFKECRAELGLTSE